ncbi:type I polyketide synthase [Motilimonas eburnea]|uniref:type I polyketide synthase n=1 Tax=Motilimonas eburnea TaxID=1737488 RepID=UPI001E52621A|nr:type I polyketide synthase [Motilimonas eburnea]MCE2573783.1 SDR family NAD(P)-dependent oxidoreductase [Motilimonas eburnea]
MTVNKNTNDSDIAIIGMSCRYPGGVNSPRQFYDFLLAGGDGIVDVPADRWDSNAYYDSDKDKANRMYVKRGGFISDIDKFDPQFFGISPIEAPHIDPQHRWLLELTQEALENAGLKASNLKGSDTGVYIGQFMHDYEQIQLDSAAHGMIASHSATGPSMTLTANRISYCFDFVGPSLTLDTACSSSLVALDMACKSLLSGDSKMAIAGGVNILLRPELTMSICKASMLSPDGRCKSFDASANGYVRSEGAGLVIVKKLKNALADGDNVLAVIKASGVNQDGQTSGITVPNGDAQERLLKQSLAKAGFTGADIQYAEAHGTGTAVGDPIEVNALGRTLGHALSGDTQRQGKCVIGSVKSNIGHTEAAAGVAGLIKTVMAMNAGVIPKNIHYHNTNPAINLAELNVDIASDNTPWPVAEGQTKKAIVNSFGFGGTNANVVIEEAPKASVKAQMPKEKVIHSLCLSAKTSKALKSQGQVYLEFLQSSDDGDIEQICAHAALSREHFKHRLVINGADKAQLIAGLTDYLNDTPSAAYVQQAASAQGADKKAFVFSGMGTTWPQMGMALYQKEPVFAAMMDKCSDAIQAYTGWSLVELIADTTNPDAIYNTEIAQPGIFAVQVSLVALLDSWGIKADAITGHSAGEVAAAYCAGALSFADAVKVIYYRSQLQQTTEGQGKMLAVALTEQEVIPYLANVSDKVSIAAINSDNALTLSGDEDGLTDIFNQLDKEGIFARFLKVGVPYHSPVMDQLKAPLIDALSDIKVLTPHTPLYSTVSGELTQEGDWNAPYWADNVREPVLFKAAINTMSEGGFSHYIEIAPHTALASSIEANLKAVKSNAVVIPTMKRGADDNLMLAATLAQLHCHGAELDWCQHYQVSESAISLPNYAWQHESYWQEHEDVKQTRLYNSQPQGAFARSQHPLLGGRLSSTTALWQNKLDLQELSYLNDHQVDNEVIYPGAAYVETALNVALSLQQDIVGELAEDVADDAAELPRLSIENIEFLRAYFVSPEQPQTLETVYQAQTGEFTISAQHPDSGVWSLYSKGNIGGQVQAYRQTGFDLAAIKARLGAVQNQADFYQHCHHLGLHYQASFQGVEHAWHNDMDSLVKITLPSTLSDQVATHLLHPAILDAAFQSLFATINSAYLPVKIGQINYLQKPTASCYGYLQTKFKDASEIKGDLFIVNEQGEVLVELLGVELKANTSQLQDQQADLPLTYHYQWQPQALPESSQTPAGHWLLLADEQGVAAALASSLKAQGHQVSLLAYQGQSKAQLSAQLEALAGQVTGIVYLWGLNAPENQGELLTPDCFHTTVAPLQAFQSINGVAWQQGLPIYIATQGAFQLAQDETLLRPEQQALWGFARVLASEHPEYKVSLVDLEQGQHDALIAQLTAELTHTHFEQELSLRQHGRFVHRLNQTKYETLAQHQYMAMPMAPSSQFELGFRKQGKTLMPFAAAQPANLAADEVLVKVDQVVLESMQLDGLSDSASPQVYSLQGRVTALGCDVASLELDEPVVFVSTQVPAAYMSIKAKLVAKLASVPSLGQLKASLTSQVALASLAEPQGVVLVNLNEQHSEQQGDLALISAAQLTAQLSQQGAKVIVAASTSEQAELFAGLPLVNEALAGIFTAAQSEELMALLQSLNQGATDSMVDAVVNFANAPSLRLAKLIKPAGQFIHLAANSAKTTKATNTALLSQLNQSDISYIKLDLATLTLHRPSLVSQALTQLVDHSVAPATQPLTCFNLAELEQASAALQQGASQVLLDFTQGHTKLLTPVPSQIITGDKRYLVTGGLGGLGLEIMAWLARNGAKSIVLIGRSAPKSDALHAIDLVREAGVEVLTLQADVGVLDDVKRVVAEVHDPLRPLAGIIHSAGVLDDATIMQQSEEKYQRVLQPKVQGSWNLHLATQDITLDFFVCFSSIAAVVGWAGQSNYASANAYMDGLCAYRRALGLSGLSINWGPWAEAGMAANLASEDIKRMNNAGMAALAPDAGLHAMAHLMQSSMAQAGVFDLDWSKIFNQQVNPAQATVFSQFFDLADANLEDDFLARFNASSGDDKRQILLAKVTETLATVLGLDTSENLEPNVNVFEYGLNSLMGMDLKNRLQASVDLSLPATLILKYPSVDAITDFILSLATPAEKATDAAISVVRESQKVKVSI